MKVTLKSSTSLKGLCSVCQQWVVQQEGGTLPAHSGTDGETCDGSYTKPAIAGRLDIGKVELSAEEIK